MSKLKALILVDDRAIRRQAFVGAFQLLRKLTDLEYRIDAFHKIDQHQFAEWRRVTFRDQEQRLQRISGEIEQAKCTLHKIDVLERVESVSRPRATAQILAEEARHQSGEIDMTVEWQKREQTYLERVNEIQQANENRERRRRDREQRQTADEERRRRDRIATFGNMSDRELDDHLQSPSQALRWLWQTLWDARQTGKAELFLRLWHASHTKIKRDFQRDFFKTFQTDFDEILAKLSSIESGPSPSPSPGPDDQSDVRSEESEFARKRTYRRLAQLLHPDKVGLKDSAPWRQELWLRTQDAYRRGNLRELEKFAKIALLRTQNLEQFRLSDVIDSQIWLGDELERLLAQVRLLKRSPAWGFSRRKDLSTPARKIERELEDRFSELSVQLEQLLQSIRFGR